MSTPDSTGLLRSSLRANAIFSALSGSTFVLASGAIAGFLGGFPPLLVSVVGGQLLLFAGALAWLSWQSSISLRLTIGVIVADLLWVIGTIGVIYADLFTRGGAGLALILADVVLLLAIAQSLGIQRARARSHARRFDSAWTTSATIAVAVLVGLPLLQWVAERSVTLPIGPSRMLTIGLCALALVPPALALLEALAGRRVSQAWRGVSWLILPLLAVSHLVAFSRFADGPFGPVPGGPFASVGVAPPDDWSRAEGLRYLEIEVDARRPRTLETVFLVHEGRLYVAANMPEVKRWPHAVRQQGHVRVRLDRDDVYVLRARYVESPEHTRILRDAMNAKYGFDLSLGGPIWFFALEGSRAADVDRDRRVGSGEPSPRQPRPGAMSPSRPA